jgi:AcrR family transcriptional regulator
MAARADSVVEHELKRLAILQAAAEVFYRRGFAAGTTKEVAAAVGLTQPAIYHYVGSKRDLLREIAVQVDRDMMSALTTALRSSTEPGEQLKALLREFTAAVVKDRLAFAVFFQEHHSLETETRDRVEKDERTFVNKVGRMIGVLQAEGRMPEGPTTLLAEAVLSMPSWLYTWYRPGGPMTADQIADVFCALIGLK